MGLGSSSLVNALGHIGKGDAVGSGIGGIVVTEAEVILVQVCLRQGQVYAVFLPQELEDHIIHGLQIRILAATCSIVIDRDIHGHIDVFLPLGGQHCLFADALSDGIAGIDDVAVLIQPVQEGVAQAAGDIAAVDHHLGCVIVCLDRCLTCRPGYVIGACVGIICNAVVQTFIPAVLVVNNHLVAAL